MSVELAKDPAIVLDTDIGYDPDDLIALAMLYKLAPDRVALITTSNETQPIPERAIFTREALRHLGSNTLVVAGRRGVRGNEKFTAREIPSGNPWDSNDSAVESLKKVVERNDRVTYIGIGGFSNLADYIKTYPGDANKIDTFMMGGALDYERYSGWTEYNIKIDPASARLVLGNRALKLTLIMAQTTHSPGLEVTVSSELYKALSRTSDPIHEAIIDHCNLWFQDRHFEHGTLMHDPLTVATALGYDFASFGTAKVSLSKSNKIIHDPNGTEIKYSLPNPRGREFMGFLKEALLR